MVQVRDPYNSTIGKLVFKKLQGISDRNECCRQLLHLWNEKILPNTPAEGSAPRISLETAQVVLHGIGAAAGDVLLRGDMTMVPELIKLWPSVWTWIKLLHAAHAQLRAGHDSAFDITTARQRYSAINKILSSFTGSQSELLHTIAETPGYISMVTSLWIEEITDPHRNFRFKVSNLLAPLLSERCDRWTNQIIAICGGHPIDVVTFCLERMTANLRLTEPDYVALNGDLIIILSGCERPDAPFRKAFATSPKSIPVITEVMSSLISSSQPPENMRTVLLALCATILSFPIRLGGFDRIIEALNGDMLPVMVKSSPFCSPLKGSQDIISILLRYDIPAYFVHRPMLSLVRKAFRRIDSLGLESIIIRGGFEQSWSTFKEVAESWITTKHDFKTRPQSRFICGNPEVCILQESSHHILTMHSSVDSSKFMKTRSSCAAQVVVYNITAGKYAKSNTGKITIGDYAKTCRNVIAVRK